MLVAIFILIPFLPAACLPWVLEAFFSDAELDEMGISLESSDDLFSIQAAYGESASRSMPIHCASGNT